MGIEIVLYDSSPVVQKIFSHVLYHYGPVVHRVDREEDLLSKIRFHSPDIIFIDSHFSKDQSLKNHIQKEAKNIPVILMGQGEDLNLKEQEWSPSKKVLKKPISAGQLREVINSFVPKTKSNILSQYLEFPPIPPFNEKPNLEKTPPVSSEATNPLPKEAGPVEPSDNVLIAPVSDDTAKEQVQIGASGIVTPAEDPKPVVRDTGIHPIKDLEEGGSSPSAISKDGGMLDHFQDQKSEKPEASSPLEQKINISPTKDLAGDKKEMALSPATAEAKPAKTKAFDTNTNISPVTDTSIQEDTSTSAKVPLLLQNQKKNLENQQIEKPMQEAESALLETEGPPGLSAHKTQQEGSPPAGGLKQAMYVNTHRDKEVDPPEQGENPLHSSPLKSKDEDLSEESKTVMETVQYETSPELNQENLNQEKTNQAKVNPADKAGLDLSAIKEQVSQQAEKEVSRFIEQKAPEIIQKAVEKAVWQVVPELSKQLILKELNRLLAEGEKTEPPSQNEE